MPGQVAMASPGASIKSVPEGWQPLDFATDMAVADARTRIRHQGRSCAPKLPKGYSLEVTRVSSLPRDAATAGLDVLLLARKEGQSRALPMRVRLTACSAEQGRMAAPINFDDRLQSGGGGWLVSSLSGGSLQVSSDGLRWRTQLLPQNSHALLSAYRDPHGSIWIAVSSASSNFALALYRLDAGRRAWNGLVLDAALPPGWLEGRYLVQQAADLPSPRMEPKSPGVQADHPTR